jgi:hypothetical protein
MSLKRKSELNIGWAAFLSKVVPSALGVLLASGALAEDRLVSRAPDGSWEQRVAGIPSEKLRYVVAGQERIQWCWAACISMGFRYYGFEVEQSDIVQRIKGLPLDQPGSGSELTRALSVAWTDKGGKKFRSRCTVFDPSRGKLNLTTAGMVEELAKEHIVIHGASGHATVVTQLTYTKWANGAVTINEAGVRDPSPVYAGAYRTLAPSEFASIYTAAVTAEAIEGGEEDVTSTNTPAAKSESFEDGLKKLWDLAPEDFESVRGKYMPTGVRGYGEYKSTLEIAGAKEVMITHTDGEWSADVTTGVYGAEPEAKAAARELEKKVVDLFGLKEPNRSGDGRTTISSVLFYKSKRVVFVTAARRGVGVIAVEVRVKRGK